MPIGKYIFNIRIIVEHAPLVKKYILVLISWPVLSEEVTNPFNGRHFTLACSTKMYASKEIRNYIQDPTSFTIIPA